MTGLGKNWAGVFENNMLSKLVLSNLATISDTAIEFTNGLNVLTGETGAGKSIVIDGLLLVLGERADRTLVREGTGTASVEGEFILPDGSELFLRREVQSQGRSRIFIDNALVTLDEVRMRLSGLIDLHTQRSTPALMKRPVQRRALDDFARCTSETDKMECLFDKYRKLKARREELLDWMESASGREEFILHELELIRDLEPCKEDYENLTAERRKLKHAKEHIDCLSEIMEGINNDNGISAELSRLVRLLERSEVGIPEISDLLEQSGILIDEADALCSSFLSECENYSWRLIEIDKRLDAYSSLMVRCGGSIDELTERHRNLDDELFRIEKIKQDLTEIEQELPQLQSSIIEHAENLSVCRQEASHNLTIAVLKELKKLSIKDAIFEVSFSPPSGKGIVDIAGKPFSRYGRETIEFRFSANPGISPASLSSVASGGEMSRVSLALKLALSEISQPATMIFDEIDSGIGGETAHKLSDSLKRAAGTKQVIVITHLAQIAAGADNHLSVKKRQTEGMPETSVTTLTSIESRRSEIARLLGGGVAAGAHAGAMLGDAEDTGDAG